MHIDLWALALQATNFAILAWLLQRFLYRPITRVVAERRALVEKQFAEATAARHQAELDRQDYERRLAGIAAERERVLAEARARAEAERRAVIEAAEAQTAAAAQAQRRQLDQERQMAVAELGDRAVELGLVLAERLLDQAGGAAVTADLLERLCAHLASMPTGHLRDRGPVLQVATRPGLDPDGQARWRQRLVPYVGEAVEIIFVTDQTLIAGAELRFPSLIVAFSWRDSLAEARATMQVGS